MNNEIPKHLMRFVDFAGRSAGEGALSTSMGMAQVVACSAWHRHFGLYAWPALEGILRHTANKIGTVETSEVAVPIPHLGDSSRRVLHVLSEPYRYGGHTRLLERWLRNTRGFDINAIIVSQRHDSIPRYLIDAVEESRGWWLPLGHRVKHLASRAQILRAISRDWADLVVLHANPDDPVPLVAYGAPGGPPVILLNHADHVFWMGASIADVVADLRPAGQRLTVARRGVPRSNLLPIPIGSTKLGHSISQARTAIGAREGEVILLTIASEYKFGQIGKESLDFISLHLHAVADLNVRLFVIGPRDEGEWASAKTKSGGKLTAVGLQDDIAQFISAADIYVDSFPFSSLTPMLEAGSLNIPIIGFDKFGSSVLTGDDSALNECGTHLSDPKAYSSSLRRLIVEPNYRKQQGQRVGDAIRSYHAPKAWLHCLDTICRMLPATHGVYPLGDIAPRLETDDLNLIDFQTVSEMSVKMRGKLARAIRDFPFGLRLKLLISNILYKEPGNIPLRYFLSRAAIARTQALATLLGSK